MAVMVVMQWQGVTKEQYEAVRKAVNWEGNRPQGGNLHTAGFSDDTMYVTDLWDSAEAFNAFTEQRLMPEVQQLGLPGQPNVTIVPLHAVYAPNVTSF